MFELTRNDETVVGIVLSTVDDMYTVQKWCHGKSYGMTINLDFSGYWSCTAFDQTGSYQNGSIGDWVVLANDETLTIYPAAKGAALFTVGDTIT